MILFFTELAEDHPLYRHGPVKTSARAARMHLKLQSNSTLHVVYPLPWVLDDLPYAAQQVASLQALLAEWLDFYIDGLALAEEYPGRVQLMPLDVLLKQCDKVPLGDSLEAYLLEQTNPEFLDLLENLELNAELNGLRDAQTRNPNGLMPQVVAERVVSLLKAQRENNSMLTASEKKAERLEQELQETQVKYKDLEKKQKEIQQSLKQVELSRQNWEQEKAALQAQRDDSDFPDLREKCKELEDENKLLLEQLFKVQEEFETFFLKNKDLEQAINEAQQKLTSAEHIVKTQEQDAAVQEKMKDLEAENELLLRQLHLVQEELERYYLELKAFKRESEFTEAACRRAQEFLRKQIIGQAA